MESKIVDDTNLSFISHNKFRAKICFLLSDQDSPFEGMARPFLNWAIGLPKENHDVYFVLLNCGKNVEEFIKNLQYVNFRSVQNFDDLLYYLKASQINIVLTDDSIKHLKLIDKIKSRLDVVTCIYVQILFGTHSIVDIFNLDYLPLKEKIVFEFTKIFPFALLKKLYKGLLQNQDVIVSNSQITSTLLHMLYGVESNHIIYPPINNALFKPQDVAKELQVLLYLGSHAGDTDEDLLKKICAILEERKIKIMTLGNRDLQERLKNQYDINQLYNISDDALARVYSMSSITICPQRWEQFGYVVAESISCGTPVLAFNCMGPSEIISQSCSGILANNKKEFLDSLRSLDFERVHVTKHSFPWDLKSSSMSLQKEIDLILYELTKSNRKVSLA